MERTRTSIPGVIVFCWAAGLFVYLIPKEPPFGPAPWTFLGTFFTHGMYLPVDAALYLHILGIVVVLAVITGIGGLFLRSVFGAARLRSDWITGFGMGLVLVAIPLEILGILHFLFFWTVLASLGLAAGVAAIPWQRWLGGEKPESETQTPEPEPEPGWERAAWWGAFALIGLISFFTLYHAVAFPVVYWDSLIYYISYAEWTYEEGGFPVKVVAQVGLGLGANYPHLYHLIQVIPAFLFGAWNDTYGQFLPPFLGVLSTILVYRTVRVIGAGSLLAILAALVFRSVPYGIHYFIHASDYSLAIFFTALFVYLAARLFLAPGPAWFLLLGLAAAGAAKVNYLMPLLSVYLVIIGWWYLRRCGAEGKKKKVVVILLASLAIASTWYVRNWIVAGNPVYPFFHGVLGGKRIDERVLASCENEWLMNSEGVRIFLDQMEAVAGQAFREMGPVGRFLTRLKWATWNMFVTAEPNYHWKFAPMLVGLALPGLLFGIHNLLTEKRTDPPRSRPFWLLVIGVFLFLIFYEYFIAGIYLYQIIPIVVPLALLAAVSLREMRGPVLAGLSTTLVLLVGVVPGLGVAIVGPKDMSAVRRDGAVRFDLRCMRLDEIDVRLDDGKPLGPRERFLLLKFGGDYAMWRWMNDNLPGGANVLSHENRHLYIRNDIEIVHMDDWELSRLYGEPWPRIREYLERNGIRYYLRIPNEGKHPIVVEGLGLGEVLDTDWDLIAEFGGNRLYRLREGAAEESGMEADSHLFRARGESSILL